jgi:hypothetical protein
MLDKRLKRVGHVVRLSKNKLPECILQVSVQEGLLESQGMEEKTKCRMMPISQFPKLVHSSKTWVSGRRKQALAIKKRERIKC